jgi:hypothetical protein
VPENSENTEASELLRQQISDLLREKLESEIFEIKGSFKDYKEETFDNCQAVQIKLNNKVEAVEAGVNKKLDAIDLKLRGNGNVGITEEIRTLKRRVALLIILVILLIGGRAIGLNLDMIKGWFFPPKNSSVEEKPTVPVYRAEQRTSTLWWGYFKATRKLIGSSLNRRKEY